MMKYQEHKFPDLEELAVSRWPTLQRHSTNPLKASIDLLSDEHSIVSDGLEIPSDTLSSISTVIKI